MSQTADAQPSVEVGRYLQVLRRRWLVVLVFVVLGIAAAGGYLALQPRQATATALVNLNVITDEPFSFAREPSGLIDPQTEVQTARSAAVVQEAADRLGGDITPLEVRRKVDVELVSDATVMRVTYASDSKEESVLGADAVSEAFLEYRGALAAAKLQSITDQLTEQLDTLREQLRQVTQRLASANEGSRRAAAAENDQALLNLELDNLLTQMNAVKGIDTSGGTVLTAASQNDVYITPSRATVFASGALLGLLLGVVAAFVREATDRRVRREGDLDKVGGALLGRLPATSREQGPLSEPSLEAARGIRERLLASRSTSTGETVILETGKHEASGLPVLLAAAFSEVGEKVELLFAQQPQGRGAEQMDALALDKVSGEGGLTRSLSDRFPGLAVSVSSHDDPSRIVEQFLRTHRGSGGNLRTIVVLDNETAPSTRMAAVRIAGHAVGVVRPGKGRTDHLGVLKRETEEVGASFEGWVLAPSGS